MTEPNPLAAYIDQKLEQAGWTKESDVPVNLRIGPPEQHIAFHATAVSQPCTNCGVHGAWSHAGRRGTYTPPLGHTLREDGTMACPKAVPAGKPRSLVPGTPEHQVEQDLLCDYLRLHGINPDQVPADAYGDINLGKRTLSVDVLVFNDRGHLVHDGPNRPRRRRVTVDLIQTLDEFRATPR